LAGTVEGAVGAGGRASVAALRPEEQLHRFHHVQCCVLRLHAHHHRVAVEGHSGRGRPLLRGYVAHDLGALFSVVPHRQAAVARPEIDAHDRTFGIRACFGGSLLLLHSPHVLAFHVPTNWRGCGARGTR